MNTTIISTNHGLHGLECKIKKFYLNITQKFSAVISGHRRKSFEIFSEMHIKKLSGTNGVPASANLVGRKVESLVLGRAFGVQILFGYNWKDENPRAGAFLLQGDLL